MNALLKRLSKMKGEEKALFFAVLVLLVLIVLCWVFLGRLLFEEKPVDSAAPQTAPETAQAALSTPEDHLPQRLFIGKAPPPASARCAPCPCLFFSRACSSFPCRCWAMALRIIKSSCSVFPCAMICCWAARCCSLAGAWGRFPKK